MKRPRISVSDKAVLRHLRHVEGLDVETLRRKIARKVDFLADHPGATGVFSCGCSYKIQNGVVTTVIPVSRNRKARRKGRSNGKV
ncbi:MAG: hypothetical protein ABJV68_27105 [Paracoccaceae bacterium]|uniref:hypothetical protein n=1 Tax=Pseudophaeobacter sp. TaxID=1971739 RepID=UPI003296ACBF